MIYEMYLYDSKGVPEVGQTPEVVCHSIPAVDRYINERISDEGLDWRVGSTFKTRCMDRPMAFFSRGGKLLKW